MNCRVVWQSVWLLTGSKGSALHVGQRTLPWHQERRAEPQCASPARAAQSVGRYGEQYGHRRAHNCPSVIGMCGAGDANERRPLMVAEIEVAGTSDSGHAVLPSAEPESEDKISGQNTTGQKHCAQKSELETRTK